MKMHKLHEDINMCLCSLFNYRMSHFRTQISDCSNHFFLSRMKEQEQAEWGPRLLPLDLLWPNLKLVEQQWGHPEHRGPAMRSAPSRAAGLWSVISYLCAAPVSRGNREVDLLQDRGKVILQPSLTGDLEFVEVQFRSGSTLWPPLGTPQIASQHWNSVGAQLWCHQQTEAGTEISPEGNAVWCSIRTGICCACYSQFIVCAKCGCLSEQEEETFREHRCMCTGQTSNLAF